MRTLTPLTRTAGERRMDGEPAYGVTQTAGLAPEASSARQWAFYALSTTQPCNSMKLHAHVQTTPSKQARTTGLQCGANTAHNFSPISTMVQCTTWYNAPQIYGAMRHSVMVHCASDNEGFLRGMALRCMRDGMVTEAREGGEAAEVSEQGVPKARRMDCGEWKN